jgi:hypothetical protein
MSLLNGEYRANTKPSGSAVAITSKVTQRVVATHAYFDESGELLFVVERLEPKKPNGFRQRRPDGNGGWIWKLGDTRRVPYLLPELLEAVASERLIFIAEGEKAVDALIKLGVIATCSPHGAGKWRQEYASHFKGADIVILPDADAPGEQHAQSIAASLDTVARKVRVLHLPDLGEGEDAFDWIQRGGNATELCKLVEIHDQPHDTVIGVEPHEGSALLDDVRAFLQRFVSYPSPEACTAHALWIAHSHLIESFESTPRLAFLSPEPSSGKTRALEVTELLVPRAVEAVNVTPAYMFRKVASPNGKPTMLCDEIDTIFGPNGAQFHYVEAAPSPKG